MTREEIEKILRYYICEDKLYVFYEKGMYPYHVKRDVLISYISEDIMKSIGLETPGTPVSEVSEIPTEDCCSTGHMCACKKNQNI